MTKSSKSLPDLRRLKYSPQTGMMYRTVNGKQRPVTTLSRGYKVIRIEPKTWRQHQIAYAMMEGRTHDEHIDHINGNKSDNRWVNLRAVTCRENMGNMKVHREGKGVGYSWDKNFKLYRTRILTPSGRHPDLGRYADAEAAGRVYAWFRQRIDEWVDVLDSPAEQMKRVREHIKNAPTVDEGLNSLPEIKATLVRGIS